MMHKNLTIRLIRYSVIQAEKQAARLSFQSRKSRMRERMMKALYIAKTKMSESDRNKNDVITP